MHFFEKNKKKIVSVLAVAIVFSLMVVVAIKNKPEPIVGNLAGTIVPGTYTATEQGFGGDVTVSITVSDSAITAVNITGDSETPQLGGAAITELSGKILTEQTPYVDAVSGATITSTAIKTAAEAALVEAGVDVAAMDGYVAEEEDNTVAAELTGNIVPGTYTATEQGFGGDVTVAITLSENEITDVVITGEKETPQLGGAAMELLTEKILKKQSPYVDAVSGATITSTAVKTAAEAALIEGGVDVAAITVAATDDANVEKVDKTLDTDIVIVGAGGAGLTAAIKSTLQGKNVLVIEKMPYAGGNTLKATGGMNAAETKYQAEQGIEDSVEQYVEDTMEGGHNLNNIDLVTLMAQKSAECIDWLDSIGAPLPKVSFSGGATNARIHSPEDGSGVGDYLVASFLNKVDELGIEVMYNTKATDLIYEDGKVTGILATSEDTNYTINAGAVILATGGFGANEEMYTQYRPDLKGTVTTNAPGATGDGIVMAQAVGADLVDIEQIQLHPTVEQSSSMLITEGVRGDGAILVNQSGKRFTNELLTRDAVSAAELKQEGSYAYLIFDQNLRDGLKAIEKYVNAGLTVQADTIEELAEQLEMDPSTLKDTLDTWNQCVADQKDEEFGRDTGMEHDLSVAPYYAIKIAPGIHHTMGGVKIDTSAEVINTDGDAIPGLFAAGEVTGGVHGGNRLGGNAVTDIVVFGNVAAESAISYIDANK